MPISSDTDSYELDSFCVNSVDEGESMSDDYEEFLQSVKNDVQ